MYKEQKTEPVTVDTTNERIVAFKELQKFYNDTYPKLFKMFKDKTVCHPAEIHVEMTAALDHLAYGEYNEEWEISSDTYSQVQGHLKKVAFGGYKVIAAQLRERFIHIKTEEEELRTYISDHYQGLEKMDNIYHVNFLSIGIKRMMMEIERVLREINTGERDCRMGPMNWNEEISRFERFMKRCDSLSSFKNILMDE